MRGMYRSHGVRKGPVHSTQMIFVRRLKASQLVVLTLKHEMFHVQSQISHSFGEHTAFVKYTMLIARTINVLY